jgi:2-phospho-L-lactate guanylyltransferase (CobY/MobA/RfbA family)
LHKEEASRVGVECRVVNNERIALDIDEPSDVERLLECGHGSATIDLLMEIGIIEKLISRTDCKVPQRTPEA